MKKTYLAPRMSVREMETESNLLVNSTLSVSPGTPTDGANAKSKEEIIWIMEEEW